MMPLVFFLAFVAPGADGEAIAPHTATTDLRTEIRQALQRSALDGAAGSVTFVKESWTQPINGGKPYGMQKWEVKTDGAIQVRAKLSFPNSDSSPEIIVGESRTRRWMVGLFSRQLFVLDKESPADPPDEEKSAVVFMGNLAIQAAQELRWLSVTRSREAPIEILLLDQDPLHLGAVVRIEQKLLQVFFQRNNGTLLLASTTGGDDQTTYKWTFSNYAQVDDRWIPGNVEFVEYRDAAEIRRWAYSQITVSAAAKTPVFDESFWVPQPGEPEFEDVYVVKTLSSKFQGEPMAVNTESLSRLAALNHIERTSRP